MGRDRRAQVVIVADEQDGRRIVRRRLAVEAREIPIDLRGQVDGGELVRIAVASDCFGAAERVIQRRHAEQTGHDLRIGRTVGKPAFKIGRRGRLADEAEQVAVVAETVAEIDERSEIVGNFRMHRGNLPDVWLFECDVRFVTRSLSTLLAPLVND